MATQSRTVGIVALLTCAGIANAAAVRATLLAVSNTQAPGLPTGILFRDGGLGSPQIDRNGNIIFRAQVTGTGVTVNNDGAIFSFISGGSPELIAREGDIAPGTGGANFLAISTPVFVNGRVVFTATLTGAGVVSTNNQAIFAGPVGSIALIARKGDLVAGTGANIGSINDFAISPGGAIAFRVILVNGGVTASNDTCVLQSVLGVTTIGGREGTALPTISATAKIGDLGSGPLVMNSAGEGEAVAPLTGAGSGSTNTLFRFSILGPQIIARAKAAAPGLPTGVNFLDIPQITTANSAGTSYFQGVLTGTGINTGNNVGVWQGSPGNVSLAFRLNGYAATTGLSFQALTTAPAVNDSGDVAFGASLWGGGATTTNNAGIFKWRAGTTSLLVWAGQIVPDLADGSVYATDAPGRVVVCDSGVVFVKMRTTDGVFLRDGLFTFRPNGSMTTLAREGDLFKISPTDSRTISAIYVASAGNSTGADGRGSPAGGVDGFVAQLAFVEGGNAIVRYFGGCPSDFNADGIIDFSDYLDFVDALSSASPEADFNGDGEIDFTDFLDFVDALSTGC